MPAPYLYCFIVLFLDIFKKFPFYYFPHFPHLHSITIFLIVNTPNRGDIIMNFEQYEKEKSYIINIALHGYLNHFRQRLKEIEDEEIKNEIQEKIRVTEMIINEMEIKTFYGSLM